MVWLLCMRVKVIVQFVHGRYNSCNACLVLREEEGCFLVVLWIEMLVVHTYTQQETNTYFKDANQIFDNDPVIIVKLILSQLQSLVCSNFVDSFPVFEDEMHHVIG
jgi:hypothetical protein